MDSQSATSSTIIIFVVLPKPHATTATRCKCNFSATTHVTVFLVRFMGVMCFSGFVPNRVSFLVHSQPHNKSRIKKFKHLPNDFALVNFCFFQFGFGFGFGLVLFFFTFCEKSKTPWLIAELWKQKTSFNLFERAVFQCFLFPGIFTFWLSAIGLWL